MQPIKRVGLYGGSFNPIHNGHIGLARQILRLAQLDEIWFCVSPQNPLKPDGSLLDDKKRLDIVRKAIKDEPGMTATDYEFHLPRPSYTWNTLHSLAQDYPDKQFTLIIGADNWACIGKWSHGYDIARHYPIIIYPRQGTSIDESSLPHNISVVHTPMINISSTEIRSLIASGQSIKGLVPENTEQDIIKAYTNDNKP